MLYLKTHYVQDDIIDYYLGYLKLINKMILRDKELSKNNIYAKGKIVDLYIETEHEYINVELNNQPNKYVNDRNLSYLASLFNKSIDKSKDYSKIKKCIQINLTSRKKDIGLKDEYAILKRKSIEECIYSQNLVIYEINLDLAHKLYYNKSDELREKLKPIIMLTLTKEELDEFSVGDERIMEYRDKVEKLNNDSDFEIFMSREEDQRRLENTYKAIIEEQTLELEKQQNLERTRSRN